MWLTPIQPAENIIASQYITAKGLDTLLRKLLSMSDEPHFIVRKIRDRQRFAIKSYTCIFCTEQFPEGQKAWEHAKNSHPELEITPGKNLALIRKQFLESAVANA